jgi:hypothetical protein
MRVRPLSTPRLVQELAERIAGRRRGQRLRVAIDGAAAAEPGALADALLDPLRVRGRAARHIPAAGFLRPASVRLELGRTNPDSFYERWLDEPGLRREVLDPAGPAGGGRVLPSLWNPVTDRATRAEYVSVPEGGVVLVSGALLLGAGLPFDFAVHLALSPAALARRTPAGEHWTLPALDRYGQEVAPEGFADVVVRVDDARRPAVVDAP